MERDDDQLDGLGEEAKLAKAIAIARVIGVFLLNTFLAVIGSVVIESGFYHSSHPVSAMAVIHRDAFFSVTIAFALGYFAYRRWQPVRAKWVWVVGLCWFGQWALLIPNVGVGGVFREISGAGCASDLRICLDWIGLDTPGLCCGRSATQRALFVARSGGFPR